MQINNFIKSIVGEDGRYHFIYLITNNVNGKYYKGVHSTSDLNDGYLGSGTALENAKEKYGKENFSLEIIKFFVNREEALRGEFEYITESDINSDNCYNICLGGYGVGIGKVSARDKNGVIHYVDVTDERLKTKELIVNTSGRTTVKDKDGNTLSVSVDDERLKDGTLVGIKKNMMTAQDKDRNIYNVSVNDERLKTGILKPLFIGQFLVRDNETGERYFVSHEEYDHQKHTSIHKNKVVVQDKDGNKFAVDCDDERFLNGELTSIHKHKHPVRDKEGNILYIDTSDERFLNGELVSITKGRVIVKDKDGNKFSVSKDDPRYLSKELVPVSTGLKNGLDKNGNIIKTTVDDIRFKTGELTEPNNGKVVLKNIITGEIKCFDKNKDKIDSNLWVHPTFGRIRIADMKGNYYCVCEDDPRLLSDDYIICSDLYPIYKDNITKRVLLSEFRKYYAEGWIYPYKTTIIYQTDLNDNILEIRHISNKDILSFIEEWNIVDYKNDVIMMKENKFRYITNNNTERYQKDGWDKIDLRYFKVKYIQEVIDGRMTVDEAKKKSVEQIEQRKQAKEKKQEALNEYFINHMSVEQICEKYNFRNTIFRRWIVKYSKEHPENTNMLTPD